MKFKYPFLSFILLSIASLGRAQSPGDTLWIQTYTFENQNNPETAYDSPGRRWFNMPADDGTEFQKILMYHKLKCFDDGTAGNLGYSCGEWDYLTYNYLFDHTGLLDSNYVSHPLYLFDNQPFDTAHYLVEPYANTIHHPYFQTEVVSTLSETTYEVSQGSEEVGYQMYDEYAGMRVQMLWRANELLAAGLIAGEIDGLDLEFSGSLNEMDWMEIRGAEVTMDSLDFWREGDWQELYNQNLLGSYSGWKRLHFNTPMIWDGTSNILMEFVYYSQSDGLPFQFPLLGGATDYPSVIQARTEDRYIDFNWFDEVKVPAEAFADIDDVITISFWLKGDPALQPQNGTTFEGINANGQRVLNSHTPWSNGQVYWDAGQDGGYDRINAQAGFDDYAGKWNHWAFTKNTNTGIMKIFLNGQEWLSGDNRDNSMAGITEFSIGAATGWENFYNGAMDEFRIWNAELTEDQIAEWMYKDLDDSHPLWDQLLVYYPFYMANEGVVIDVSGNGFHGVAHGSSDRREYTADELFRNFNLSNMRPNVRFVRGEYETNSTEGDRLEYVLPAVRSLATWQVVGNGVELESIAYFYPEGYSYGFDENGAALDSVWQGTPQEIVNGELNYFEPPYEVVDRYELGRFITPYGIGLDLDDGWTWVYDVTDFAPFLRDSVDLVAGNWQELLDLKFAFIYGTPPRDVNRVERVWNGNWGLSNWEDDIAEKTFVFDSNDATAKLTTTTTGHGFGNNANNCAEFCNNIHGVQVNGNTEWSWQIVQECADNPLYPQGGTWIYDRAGWCPGMEGRKYEFELTPWVSDGEVTLDYDIQTDPYGNYVFESYLFTYGAPNFEYDVEISEILAPSISKLNSRDNPICSNPIVRIRNNGAQTLTSCVFTYNIQGGESSSFTWEGELPFMETIDVELDYPNTAFYYGQQGDLLTFEIAVDAPNGQVDENPSNNYSQSQFYQPPVYTYGEGDLDDNRLILWMKTNSAPWESSYDLYNSQNEVIFSSPFFTDGNTNYRDTLQLNEGCYTVHLKDSDHDGLSFFANNDGGGTLRLKKVGGSMFYTFNSNFGKESKHSFYWKTSIVGVEELSNSPKVELNLFPNPVSRILYFECKGFGKNLVAEIYTGEGRLVEQKHFVHLSPNYLKSIDVSDWSNGMFLLRISDGTKSVTQHFIVNH